MSIDFVSKVLITVLVVGVGYTYRYPLLIDPIAQRVLAFEESLLSDLRHAGVQTAAEDTARYIADHMQGVESSPDRYELFKKSIASARVKGLYCEFGVWKGASINFIADLIPDRAVHGFDSFEGLPEAWRDDFGKGTFAINGLPPVRKNVVLHKGWFDKVLPDFRTQHSDPIAFVHMDADLYSSTATVLEGMADRIVTGTVIQFDEFFNYPGWQHGEFQAFNELVQRHNLKFSFIGYANQQVAVVIAQR